MNGLLAILACATLVAAPAQQQAVREVGTWRIIPGANECIALDQSDDAGMMIGLIYPRPGKKADAALMIISAQQFADVKDRAPYPVRLVPSDSDGLDTRWLGVEATGIELNNGRKGIRIAAPFQAFGDSLARAEALRLEGKGQGTMVLEVAKMHEMVDALRSCAGTQ